MRSISRTHRSRAQTLVEFALIVPLFIALVTSIAEFGLLFKDYMVLNYAARDGARVAAAAGSTANADTSILVAVTRATATLDRTKIVEVRIFKADASGNPVGSMHNVYIWNTGSSAFVLSGTEGWAASTRDDSSNPDRVGVKIQYNHNWVTGRWFGGSFVVSDSVVMRIEPKSTI